MGYELFLYELSPLQYSLWEEFESYSPLFHKSCLRVQAAHKGEASSPSLLLVAEQNLSKMEAADIKKTKLFLLHVHYLMGYCHKDHFVPETTGLSE